MSLGILSLGRIPASAFGLVAVVLALGGLAFANTDALLERGFEQALGEGAAPKALASSGATAGSEDFWLRGEGKDKRIVPAAMKPLAPGARIAVSSGGVDRVLVVATVTELPDAFGRVLADARSDRLVLVTCRDVTSGGEGPLVRLVLTADGAWPTLAASPPHAL